MKKQIILLPATLLLALGAVQGQDVKERLKAHVYTLASDEFAGRKPNTHGDTLAANYIREQLKAMPGFKLLAKDGLQEFSYQAYRNLAAEGNMLKAGKRALTLGRDFLPSVTSANGSFSGEVVDMGEGKPRDYAGKDVKGKFVVVHLTPRSYADGSEQRSRETAALQNGAKGILLVGQPLSNLPARWPTKDGFYVAKVTDKAAKELLTKKQMEANVAIDLSTEHTFNVVAKIEAPKANNPEGDVLILGAHYDHMGIEEYEGEPAIFHGADDNASGTAGILELARYISDRRDFLKKDVIVILFGAEERGLKGSRYYAANPVEPLDNVKAMVNIDMMGRMPAEKTLGIRGLGSAYEAPALFASLPNNDNLELVWEFREKGPTDYSSFYDKGIPAFSFGTPHHVDYHKPTDTKERVNYDGMVMVYDYATNLINRLAFEPLRLTYRPQQK